MTKQSFAGILIAFIIVVLSNSLYVIRILTITITTVIRIITITTSIRIPCHSLSIDTEAKTPSSHSPNMGK